MAGLFGKLFGHRKESSSTDSICQSALLLKLLTTEMQKEGMLIPDDKEGNKNRVTAALELCQEEIKNIVHERRIPNNVEIVLRAVSGMKKEHPMMMYKNK